MTETDISPEAVERLACILEGRGGFVKDSTITATLRALSAALTQSRAETATLRSFIADFAAFDFAACYRHPTSSPEDDGDDVTDAEPVWAWQEDARALTTPDQASALAAVEAAAEARGMRKASEIAQLNAWCHQGTDAYSQGMDAGARHQCKVIHDAILAAIPQGEV